MKSTLTALLLFLIPAAAHASYVINLGGREVSNLAGAVPNIRNDAVTLTFEQESANTVLLTMRATVVEGGSSSEWWWSKGKSIAFNSAVAIDGFQYVDTGAGSVKARTHRYANNGINTAGGGKFDVRFEFHPKGENGTFYPPLHSTYRLTGTGLTEESFRQASLVQANGGENLFLYGMIHINLPPGGFESGWYGSTGGGDDFTDPVPEPTSVALWVLGCCAAPCARRRMSRR